MSATRDQIYKSTQAQYTSDGLQDSMRVEAMVVLGEQEQDMPVADQLRRATNSYFGEDVRRFFSPGHDALPLQRINARHVAPGLVQLTVDYGGRNITGDGSQVVDFQTVQVPVTVFAQPGETEGNESGTYERGLPMGETIGAYESLDTGEASTSITGVPADIVNTMRVDTHERNCIRALVRRTDFGVNPIVRFQNAVRKTNKGVISVAGLSCPPGTLLFEGIDSTASTIGTSDPTGQTPSQYLIYNYAISLLYDPFGFPIHRWDVSDSDDATCDLVVVDQYDRSSWFL